MFPIGGITSIGSETSYSFFPRLKRRYIVDVESPELGIEIPTLSWYNRISYEQWIIGGSNVKSEFTNILQFALSMDGNIFHLVFEQARPVIVRDPEDTKKISVSEMVSEELIALTMTIDDAQELADEISKAIAAAKRGYGQGE